MLVLLVVVGYGAVAYLTGFEKYVHVLRGHSHYVTLADSVANTARPPLTQVLLTYLDPFEAGKVMLLINLLALIGIVGGRHRIVAEVLLTFVPFFVFSMLAANPAGASRFSLNYLAGPVILAVVGIDVLARLFARLVRENRRQVVRIAVQGIVVAMLVGRLITWGLPAFEVPRKTVAPPTAAAMWLRDHVPTTSTLFVDGSAQPWMTYFTPRHRRVVVRTTAEMLAHPAAVNGWYIALAPPPPDGAMAFLRPRNRTWNIVTKRGFEAFVQPMREVVGFGDGWYNLEDDGAVDVAVVGATRGHPFRPGDGRPRAAPGVSRAGAHAQTSCARDVHARRQAARLDRGARRDNEVRYVIHGRSDRVQRSRHRTQRRLRPRRKTARAVTIASSV